METDTILTTTDLERVKKIMEFYKRTSGWIEFVNDKIMFFDSKPSFGGCFITLEQVHKSLQDDTIRSTTES